LVPALDFLGVFRESRPWVLDRMRHRA